MKSVKNHIVLIISLMMILPFTFSCDRLDIIAPRGKMGKTGPIGKAPTIIIGDNGNWFIDGVDSGKTAIGKDGKNPIVTIGENGNWIIDGVDTENRAIGKDGVDGKDGKDGAQGPAGAPGRDGKDGERGIQGAPGAQGIPGTPGAPGERGPAGPSAPVEPEKPAIVYPTVKITGSRKHKGGSLYELNASAEDKAKFDFVLRDARNQFGSESEVYLNESDGFYLNSTVYYAGTSSCDLWISVKGESKWIKVGKYSQVETGGGFFGPSTFDRKFEFDPNYPGKK